MSSYDYTIPCGKSKVHPEGVCRQKLHKNIASGLTKLSERHEQEQLENQMRQQHDMLEQQKRDLELKQKMLGVGAGTHRVIAENRAKFKPKAKPHVPAAKPNNNNKPS